MINDRALHTGAAADTIDQLRLFAGRRGGWAAAAVERHLAHPRYRPALTRVLFASGAPIGYALIIHERRRLGQATIDVGHLGDLFVQSCQSEDDRLALLADCLGALSEQGLPLLTLRGPVEQFEPYGCAPYRFSSCIKLAAPAAPARADALRPMTSDDLEDCAALYAATYETLPLTPWRVAPDWRVWPAPDQTALLLEDRHRRVVGYAVLRNGPAGVSVIEAAAADMGVARALIAALQAHVRAGGWPTLNIVLPMAHPVGLVALYLGGTAEVTGAPPSGTVDLAGVVDLPGLLAAMAPELSFRQRASRYAQWSGNLRIETAYETITLALEPGRAMVVDGVRPADVRLRSVALTALVQLCLGYRSAADLRATGGLSCDDSALGLLDTLFPVAMPCGEVTEYDHGSHHRS